MAVSLVVEVEGVVVGWVEGRGCANGVDPPALAPDVAAAVAASQAAERSPEAAARKAAVRDLLRHGRYRPTGRGKPASEYLCHAAAEGRFPRINALVDSANLVSLETLLPISLVDVERAGAEAFAVRWGREGESYVFNPSGQVLDLRDLLLVARRPGDRPCASPVKDSQETKTDANTRAVLAVIYGPEALREAVRDATARLAVLIERHGGASVTWGVLPP